MPKPAPCVNDIVCLRCDPCPAQKACRVRALVRFEPADAPFVDLARCTGCVRCVVACPYSAVRPPGHCHDGRHIANSPPKITAVNGLDNG